jgi:thioredoxin-related protein
MFNRINHILTLVTFLLAAGAAIACAQGIGWGSDLGSATAEAKRTGKVIMVDVYTDWCGWCKRLDADTYTNARVIEGAKQFVALKLNPEKSDSEARFARKYGVSGYPTILFVEADGTLVNKVVGYVDAPAFAAVLTKTTEYGRKTKAYLAEFRSGAYRNSPELLSMLVELGRVEEAIPMFDTVQAGASLPAALRENVALAIARHYLESDHYERALKYVRVVEEVASGSDATRSALLMHAVVLFYTRGRQPAVDYLDRLCADPKTPAGWKDGFRNLADRMKGAEEEGGS